METNVKVGQPVYVTDGNPDKEYLHVGKLIGGLSEIIWLQNTSQDVFFYIKHHSNFKVYSWNAVSTIQDELEKKYMYNPAHIKF